MNSRRRSIIDGCAVAALLFVLALLPFTGDAVAQSVPPELCVRLEDHGDLETLPDTVEALQLIFRLQAPDSVSRGKLVPNPGGLPPGPPTLPSEATSKPGYYVGVTEGTEATRYVYLVRLADPSHGIGEASGAKDEIQGEVFRQEPGVLATRVPFIPNGRLIICEILAGQRTVLVDEPLGPGPIPAQGTDFKGKER